MMLLNIFFRELLGPVRLLPYPLPDIQLSLVLGLIFFLLEFFVGHLLGHPGEVDESKTGAVMGTLFPWLGLAALALVETYAYATLSRQIDLTTRFNLDSTSPLYGPTRYFLAFLGLAITGIIAGLGYRAARQYAEYAKGRDEAAYLRLLQASVEASTSHRDRIEEVTEALGRMRAGVEAVPSDLAHHISSALGTDAEHSQLSMQVGALLEQLNKRPDDEKDIPPIRTTSTVFTELAVRVFMACLLAAGIAVSWWIYGTLVRPRAVSGRWLGFMLGFLVTTAIVGLGFVLRDARSGGRRGTLVRAVMGARHQRLTWAIVTLIGLLLLGAAHAVAAARVHLLGNEPVINALVGGALAVFLGLLGGFLDEILTGLIDVAHLIWIGAAWVLGRLTDLLGWLGKLVLDLARFLGELLAIPGGWLRRARRAYA